MRGASAILASVGLAGDSCAARAPGFVEVLLVSLKSLPAKSGSGPREPLERKGRGREAGADGLRAKWLKKSKRLIKLNVSI